MRSMTAPTATSPLLARRGGRDIKRNIAKLPLMERTGWWFKISINVLAHHPVCAESELRDIFLRRRSAPPGQEGQKALPFSAPSAQRQ